MLILGIETSCDETSAGVVEDGRNILSNVILSQVDIHKKFGGVVPEIASRHHVESILQIIEQALNEAGKVKGSPRCQRTAPCDDKPNDDFGLTLDDIDAIAVTQGPGLIGPLMVGLSTAKAISFAKNIPLVGVNHIEAHIYANLMEAKDEILEFPFIALVVSGGHTSLINVKAIGEYEVLGKTIDDAAGESFDKVAKLLGLEYPGGPIVDRLSEKGNDEFVKFPRPCINDGTYRFSFSGLKTAVLYFLRKQEKVDEKFSDQFVYDVCASFQKAVVDVLSAKTFQAANDLGIDYIAVGGGVSMNSELRAVFKHRAEKENKKVFFPAPKLCMDNGAMIAGLAFEMLKHDKIVGFDAEAFPGMVV